ncbi:hypothetical protein NDU88_006266 [Pleurodeles waltl]|uniref:Uncharacterized protein n=1 Tax=Pleurodeles waltl TaxID=8319 RepID=A0AAV7MZX3_PLEWA|nr:hypothetical protein NDU88_006266 [Pleurodeles waltl]
MAVSGQLLPHLMQRRWAGPAARDSGVRDAGARRSCLCLEVQQRQRPGPSRECSRWGGTLPHPEQPLRGPRAVTGSAAHSRGVSGDEAAGRKMAAEKQDPWAGWRRRCVHGQEAR